MPRVQLKFKQVSFFSPTASISKAIISVTFVMCVWALAAPAGLRWLPDRLIVFVPRRHAYSKSLTENISPGIKCSTSIVINYAQDLGMCLGSLE